MSDNDSFEKLKDLLTPDFLAKLTQVVEVIHGAEQPTSTTSKKIPSKKRSSAKKSAKTKNKFEESDLFNAYKEDSELDAKLWSSRKPAKRPKREQRKVVVKCGVCKVEQEVDSSEVYFMSRNEYSFTCNRCLRGKR